MPALVKDRKKRWPGKIPYVIANLAKGKVAVREDRPPMTEKNFRKSLREFNAAVGADVFVPRGNEENYIVFEYGWNSPIGMQGGPQECAITSLNAYHEMGHIIGLGHPYFHTWSRIPSLLEGQVDKGNYDMKRWDLEDYMGPNFPSMMGYTPDVWRDSPRLVRVVGLIGTSQTAVGPRCEIAKKRAQEKLFAKKRDTPVPENPKKTKKTRKPRLWDIPRKLQGDINLMTQAELEQLLEDLDIVKEYWTFEQGFEMKVHPIDKNAVRHLLGISQSWHGSTLQDKIEKKERGIL
jgi:hypothetical protein